MRASVNVRIYPTPSWSEKEILRYAGVGANAPSETLLRLRTCMARAAEALTYKVCYAQYPIKQADGMLDLGFAQAASKDLKKALADCSAVLVFAATVGIGMDRLIAAASRRSPADAVLLQAIGCERVEALCDLFCTDLADAYAQEGILLRPRFSPGYGDLPLSLQRDIFLALDCTKHIGVTLGENLLMSPQKSVTALVGLRTAHI